jgi:hypothetical protein
MKVLLALIALTAFSSAAAAGPMPRAGETREFFVDEEIDFIRDAQGISMRVPALLKLANIRLVTLGMKEKSKEDKDLEKRIAEIHDELFGKLPLKPSKPGEKPKQPANDSAGPYLTDLTRIELLRGYIEALDEIRGDIDDAYRQNIEVRGPLEQFEKFCSTSGPLLQRFQARNAAEFQAIADAKSATQESLEQSQDALKKVPKTEKTTRP